MDRVYNFSAGPSALPLEALEQAQRELVCYGSSGMSVMEMSHRSKDYLEIIEGAESLLRELMGIPSDYEVMFLQGGASTQFAMVPLNLFTGSKEADYVSTGMWSKKAISEAKKFGKVSVVASSEDSVFNYIPELDPSAFNKNADYFHITLNNTIYGTRFTKLPDTQGVPLVTDMSSSILSEAVDVSKFGVIYAGAQKNLGPSGVTVVIMRKDLIKDVAGIPTMLSYKIHADNQSLYNTPPTFGIYVMKLVLEWVKRSGGVSAIQATNEEKAGLLYDFLDNSALFKATVAAKCDRSLMNITFVLPTEELNEKFIKESKNAGFVNLKGHRSVGGMRASIYNAIPLSGVKALVGFMKEFEVSNKI